MHRNILLIIFIISAICTLGNALVLNNNNNSNLKIIYSSKILEDISFGRDIELNKTKIIGDLNFECIKHKYPNEMNEHFIINNSIHIIDSYIYGKVGISGIKFSNDISFQGTDILDSVEIKNSIFDGKFIFVENNLWEYASFEKDIFNKEAYLVKSSFKDYANFENVKFNRRAQFNGAHFEKHSKFLNARFGNYTDFNNVQFNKAADFRKTKFLNTVEFNNAIFQQTALFYNSTFYEEAKFSEANFREDAKFWGAIFLGDALFPAATFDKNIFYNYNPSLGLNGCEFYGDLILDDTNINNIFLDNAKFYKHLSLNNSNFEKLVAKWDLIKKPLNCNGETFLKIIKSYKEQERFHDADECYYHYRSRSKSGWLDYLSLITCGYGVRPHYTLILSLFLISIFGLFFAYGEKRGFIRLNSDPQKTEATRILMDGFILSLLAFSFQTEGECKANGFYKMLAILEGLLGLLLLALFTVTLANIMIRY